MATKLMNTALRAALTALVVCVSGQAQPAPASASSRMLGEVVGLDAPSKRISLKDAKGEAITVTLTGKATLRKVPPGAPDLTKAAAIDFSDLAVGDRILAIGQISADQKQIEARSVIAMTRSDLGQKQQLEQEEWRKRGISGTVSETDLGANIFTVKTGAKSIQVQPSAKAEFRRYAPDSVKFSDARSSSFAEIKVGDLVRALGIKSEDGNSIKAEQIVSGSFRQIAATITSINPEAGELVVTDLASKKALTVRVNTDSTMKKLPLVMASALARRYQAGGARSARGSEPSGPGGPPPAGAGSGDIAQMLERLPAMALAELKSGDAIMASTTMGSDPRRVAAVLLLAGVEPILTASPTAARDIIGGWNLGSGTDQ